MHNRWLLLVALGLAVSILMVLPVYAAPSSTPSAIPCESSDGRTERRFCKWVATGQAPTATPAPAPTLAPPQGVLPYTYAYVTTGTVALYAKPADADSGLAPIRTLDIGYNWVRLAGEVNYKGQRWYLTDGGGYLPASLVAIYHPSTFQGITVRDQPALPFAWVLTSVKTASQPGGKPDATSKSIKRYDLVNIYEQREAGDKVWYRVGENQWLVQTAVARVEQTRPPEGVGPAEKWIDVNLFEQTVVAYEGDRMVYATLTSTGLRRWPTIKGLFRIYYKVALGPMSGQEGKPDYYSLEDVPWAMYFHEGYSLHGTYWHDSFGYQHSHGCANLSPLDAKWLYDWTTPVVAQGAESKGATKDDPGAWVWVHD